jgi:hypothetical protein
MPSLRRSTALCLAATILTADAQNRTVIDADFQRIHKSMLLIDTHNDVTSKTVTGFDIGKSSATGHTGLRAILRAHVARITSMATIPGCAPKGLDDVSKLPNLTRALLEQCYCESEIRKIYGENVLRVMRAVEAESRRQANSPPPLPTLTASRLFRATPYRSGTYRATTVREWSPQRATSEILSFAQYG